MSGEKSIKENKYESQLTGKSGETVNEERNSRDKLLKNIYNLPSTICNTLIIVSAIYVVGSICIICMYLQNGGDAINNINALAEANIISVGLATVAIAVSVWVGLNIYNYLSRDEVDRLQGSVKAIQKVLNETNGSFHDLAFQTLISTISRSGDRYIISSYFADKIRRTDLSRMSIELINRLTIAESEYDDVTEYYEANRLADCYQTSDAVKDTFIKLKKEIEKIGELSEYQSLQEYINSRIADCLFYKNVSADKKVDEEEMREVISKFKSIVDFINEDETLQPRDKETYLSYCNNTIGYTYDQIYINASNTPDESDLDEAIAYSKKAVDNPGNMANKQLARYTRNLGLAYHHKGKLENALDKYKESVALDGSDYKSWNNIASATLAIMGKELNISGRKKVLCEFAKDGFKKYEDKLKYAKTTCEMSISINPVFIDPYYNLINVHSYLYLGGYDQVENRAKGIERIDFLDSIANGSRGFWFAKRNFYEACGMIEEANKFNDEIMIKDSKKNDTSGMKNVYQEYLENYSVVANDSSEESDSDANKADEEQ